MNYGSRDVADDEILSSQTLRGQSAGFRMNPGRPSGKPISMYPDLYQLEPKLRAGVSRLLTAIGHDLRQPIQLALLSIDDALDYSDEKDIRQCLDVAKSTLWRMNDELHALAVTGYAYHAEKPICSRLGIEGLLQVIDAEWRCHAELLGVELRFLSSSLEVTSNRDMLLTILRNLVGNAVKYSRRGGRVLIGCRRSRGEVRIEVHDRGHGIDTEQLSALFKPFARGEDCRAHDGLGLGLFLTHQMATFLRHELTVKSHRGRGSSFSVIVPMAEDT
jgi:signal transduction histidine kinase